MNTPGEVIALFQTRSGVFYHELSLNHFFIDCFVIRSFCSFFLKTEVGLLEANGPRCSLFPGLAFRHRLGENVRCLLFAVRPGRPAQAEARGQDTGMYPAVGSALQLSIRLVRHGFQLFFLTFCLSKMNQATRADIPVNACLVHVGWENSDRCLFPLPGIAFW